MYYLYSLLGIRCGAVGHSKVSRLRRYGIKLHILSVRTCKRSVVSSPVHCICIYMYWTLPHHHIYQLKIWHLVMVYTRLKFIFLGKNVGWSWITELLLITSAVILSWFFFPLSIIGHEERNTESSKQNSSYSVTRARPYW
jgi:hypothetical protein